ncbi:zinc finger, CCHC-type containing protein, partial [Tanacetum coccineum]
CSYTGKKDGMVKSLFGAKWVKEISCFVTFNISMEMASLCFKLKCDVGVSILEGVRYVITKVILKEPLISYVCRLLLFVESVVVMEEPVISPVILSHPQNITAEAFRWHLEEIHMTWAQLEKKQTRLRLYINYLEEKHTMRGDGVANYKRRRQSYQVTASWNYRRWNNVVPNGCSFPRLRSEDQNQHLKDFLKLLESLDLNGDNRERTRMRLFQFSFRDQASNWLERLPTGSISTWEDLTTCFLAQFFPPGRTAKLRNNIMMFQQHQGESLSKVWTRFKDLLQKVPQHGIDLWLQVQIFYDHVNPATRRTIDQSAAGKLHDRNAKESWALLEDLALYDNESWNDPRDFDKSVKAISLP